MSTVSAKPAAPSRSTHWRRMTAVAARWLHIYLSMGSFALVLFFSVTGLTLNHPDWFPSKQQTVERHGEAEKAMLAGPDKLGLVEMLRSRERIHGAVGDFRVDDAQLSISFRAPGYTADVFIDRRTGKYDLTEVRNGFVAVINDLHKGRDAGTVWSVLLDVSAVLLVLVSVTGLVLIWFVYKRRTSGLILAAAAGVVSYGVWKLFVP